MPSVFELYSTRYHFEQDGTGTKEVIARVRILTEMGTRQYAEEVFEYHPLGEELYVKYVRVRSPTGLVSVVEADVHHPLPKGVTIDTNYDQRKVQLPALSVGDEVEYDVLTILHRSLGQSEFTVQHTFEKSGVLDERLDVEIPKDQKVNIKDLSEAHFWRSSSGSWSTLHWENHSPEAHEVLFEAYQPGRTPDVQVSSFATWEEVGKWYAKTEEAAIVVTPDVKARADELTRGRVDDRAKVKALYDFAAKNIRYLSLVSLGIGGVVPHTASETLHNQYGDCKDKVALLNALLKAEGFEPATVLISPDRELDNTFPGPWPFDHVIATLVVGNEQIWMDPSPQVLPFGMLAYSLRAKTGLVIPDSGPPYLQRTSAESTVPNSWSEIITGAVTDQGSLKAVVMIKASGDSALPLRRPLLLNARMSPIEIVPGLDWQDTVTEVSTSNLSDIDAPFSLSFHVDIPSFIHILENSRVQLPLSILAVKLPTADAHNCTQAISQLCIGPPGKYEYEAYISLPTNINITLPMASALNNDFAAYSTSYSITKHVFTIKRSFLTKQMSVPVARADEYAHLRKEIQEDDSITLAVHLSQ